MADWLEGLKVVVCAGTGGVGKTTVAAALGWRVANQGRRVLVLTIDPARRLADALGIQARSEEQCVTAATGGELYAAMIDPGIVFADFVRRAAPRPEVAERLLKNRLFGELSSTLSGSQEFTALERLLVAVESERYDLIILDTPPTQHAIDFLRAPERIFALFQDSVTGWFIQSRRPGLLGQLLSRSTVTVLGALEKITGSGFISELGEFFMSCAEIQNTVAKRSIAVHRLLAQAHTGFVLVTAFDDAKMKEAVEFAGDLARSGHALRAVVINRALPEWLHPEASQAGLAGGDDALMSLARAHSELTTYYRVRDQVYEQLLNRMGEDVRVLRIPEEKHSIDGVEGLKRIATRLEEGT